MPLKVGQKAPDFEVVSSAGKKLASADFLGKKNVVIYFYPADFTLVCTRETCGFRDAHEDLAGMDTVVIGVSVDSDESHRKFAEEYKIPFDSVADENRDLARRYEAVSFLRNLMGKSGRVTYVIDKQGVIAGVFESELRANTHVEGARAVIEKLRQA